jgi:hypothetical protein
MLRYLLYHKPRCNFWPKAPALEPRPSRIKVLKSLLSLIISIFVVLWINRNLTVEVILGYIKQ